jgi:hypothetical protein
MPTQTTQPTVYHGELAYPKKNEDGSTDYYDKDNKLIGHDDKPKSYLEFLKEQYGTPLTTILDDSQNFGKKRYTFVTPEGADITVGEGGGFIGKGSPLERTNIYSPYELGRIKDLRQIRTAIAKNEPFPENYKSMYSPRDQQIIEQYEATRSEIGTDPELQEDERQILLNKIDAKISAVPHISPIMQEPTPQEVFQSSIVTDPATNMRGTYDPKNGKFTPIEADTMTQKQKEKWNERFEKNLDMVRKEQLEKSSVKSANYDPTFKPMDDPHTIQKAKTITDMEQGIASPQPEVDHSLDAAWQVVMTDIYAVTGTKAKRADENIMIKAMDKFIQLAYKSSSIINYNQAKAEFVKRWQNELGGGVYGGVVPEMDEEMRRKAQIALVNPIRGDIPYGFNNDPNNVSQSQPQQKPIYAVNPKTKARIVSYDGGQTWQPVK